MRPNHDPGNRWRQASIPNNSDSKAFYSPCRPNDTIGMSYCKLSDRLSAMEVGLRRFGDEEVRLVDLREIEPAPSVGGLPNPSTASQDAANDTPGPPRPRPAMRRLRTALRGRGGGGGSVGDVERTLIVERISREKLAATLAGEGASVFDFGGAQSGYSPKDGWLLLGHTFAVQEDGTGVFTLLFEREAGG